MDKFDRVFHLSRTTGNARKKKCEYVTEIYFIIFILFFFTAVFAPAEEENSEWYISNNGGMALEKTFRARALREKHSLQVQYVQPSAVPLELFKFYSSPWIIECRILYENGKRRRTQWSFWDEENSPYFVAVIGDEGSGFIEWYDETGRIVEEQRLDADGGGYYVSYTYNGSFLIKAETTSIEPYIKEEAAALPVDEAKAPDAVDGDSEAGGEDAGDFEIAESGEAAENDPSEEELILSATPPPEESADFLLEGGASTDGGAVETPEAAKAPEKKTPYMSKRVRNPEGAADFPAGFVARTGREGVVLWVDSYRYARSKAIRSVERRLLSPDAAKQDLIRMEIPRRVEKDAGENRFVEPAVSFMSNFLADVVYGKTERIVYNTDDKWRIISETFYNEKNEILGELKNFWNADRILTVTWKGEGDERRVEFTYNSQGDRVQEKDYRGETLERTVTLEKNLEIERIYKNGAVIMEAVWEDGRKISEQRIRRDSGAL
ncbi:MAG: hypothetical protein LBC53_03390 [Spirochaetaceae bacterium]|jgi:hypothetical protein|nr:hypothetical protein [Spirochaetaceae bacterium]